MTVAVTKLSRRMFLSGQLQPPVVYISSAVVSVLPKHWEHVLTLLSSLPEVEVRHRNASKIVIVLEGPDSGALGARLAEISAWEGVLSANMVFEQMASLAELGEQS
jgi:nitrate reductase NapD